VRLLEMGIAVFLVVLPVDLAGTRPSASCRWPLADSAAFSAKDVRWSAFDYTQKSYYKMLHSHSHTCISKPDNPCIYPSTEVATIKWHTRTMHGYGQYSLTAGMACGPGCTPALYVTTAPLTRHMWQLWYYTSDHFFYLLCGNTACCNTFI